MVFLRSLAILESRNSKIVCNFAPVRDYDVFISTIDFADSISLIHTIASIGRLAHEDTSLLQFIRQILKFSESRSGFELSLFSFLFLGCCVSPLYLFIHRNIRTLWWWRGGRRRGRREVRVVPGHAVIFELLRWTGKRSPLHHTNYGSTLTIQVVSSVPILQLIVAADSGWCSSICIHSSS